jgi:hypothetical protein
MNKLFKQAYIVTVDMGYGHQRAVFPLKGIAARPIGWKDARIITANNYLGIPEKDKKRWNESRKLYETISRMKHIPIIGDWIFSAMDYFQKIDSFYPERDLSKPTMQVRQIYKMIKKGWGKSLIEILNKNPLPMVNSFFATAFFAEEHDYKGEIYCICTDTDISRAWAPLNPFKTRIKYLAPNKRVKQRLLRYGIAEKNIFVTGFPLPKENIGGESLSILKNRIGKRITNLDPNQIYQKKYQHTLEYYLGAKYCWQKSDHPLTLTFAVGGAGAQREIGAQIFQSLKKEIAKGRITLNLIAGTNKGVYNFYLNAIKPHKLFTQKKNSVNILYHPDKSLYFSAFNKILLKTDILWTKPSELSFYAGLGIPIIMAPTIGSQEEYNKAWLHSIGAGFEQEDPKYTNEWLFDWLESGWLAQAAMHGFLDAPRNGAYHIEDIVLRGKRSEIEEMHLL